MMKAVYKAAINMDQVFEAINFCGDVYIVHFQNFSLLSYNTKIILSCNCKIIPSHID